MKLVFTSCAALATASLVACGGDIYVSDPASSSSSASLECTFVAGDNVCDRELLSVPEGERAQVRESLQAISDYASLADTAANELEAESRAIVEETSGTLPTLAEGASRADRLRAFVSAAQHAIEESERALRVTLPASPCRAPDVRTCTMRSVVAPSCTPAPVTVTTAPGASATAVSVAGALSRHAGVLGTVKARLETMASLSAVIAGSASTIADAPSECVVVSSTLTREATAIIQETTSASARLVDSIAKVTE